MNVTHYIGSQMAKVDECFEYWDKYKLNDRQVEAAWKEYKSHIFNLAHVIDRVPAQERSVIVEDAAQWFKRPSIEDIARYYSTWEPGQPTFSESRQE